MMPDEDFGGADVDTDPPSREALEGPDVVGDAPMVERDLKPDNVIPFPNLRPNEKLGEQWRRELARTNDRTSKRYTFVSPLGALDDLIRKRGMASLPWPSAWPELGKRCRLYPGECAGVVGPTGGGKTSFGIQVGRAASAAGIPVLWSPKELDAPELDLRIVANMTGLHTARIRDDWSREQISRQLAAIDDLWRFVDNVRDTADQLAAYRTAIQMARQVYGRPPLLVVDYMGKFGRNARDPRLAIADAAEAIREMVLAEDCWCLMLSQPSRSNNATLTGKNEIEHATDAVAVAGESSEIEHACSVLLGLNVFKVDDAAELDAHILVTKARATGREGREGFRFCKPGGVWKELDYLPATPTAVASEVKKAKKDKMRTEPATRERVQADMNAQNASEADSDKRRRILAALGAAGPRGMTAAEIRGKPGTGAGRALEAALQELQRAGNIMKLTTGAWRAVYE